MIFDHVMNCHNPSDSYSVNLRLHKMEGYLHGPTPVMATKYTTSEDVIVATQNVSQEMHNWIPNLSQVIFCCHNWRRSM
jgi:hypothetical protein